MSHDTGALLVSAIDDVVCADNIRRSELSFPATGDARVGHVLLLAAPELLVAMHERSVTPPIEALLAERASLLRRNEELSRALRTRQDYFAMLSHELRTPIHAMLGMTEVLRDEVYGELSPKQQACVRVVEESGRHLLGLINDVLDLSRIESGRLALRVEDVPMDVLCGRAFVFVESAAEKKGVRLFKRYGTVDRLVSCDERRMTQVVLNLLANSIRFTPEGGAVGLDVEARGDRVRISVWDTGVGIAEAEREAIFEPFVQVGEPKTERDAGSGLGLSVARRLVELHGGTLLAESAVGVGSRFTIALPAVAREQGSDREPGLPVLIVSDDDRGFAPLFGHLASRGIVPKRARAEVEALHVAYAERPAVIVLGAPFASASHLEAVRRLGAHPNTRGTAIIVVAALTMEGDQERCLAAGATAYLTGLFRESDLSEHVDALLEKERP